MVWNKTYGGPGWDVARAIVGSDDGGFVVVGSTSPFPGGGKEEAICVLKINGHGDLVWEGSFGASLNSNGYGLLGFGGGEYLVVGTSLLPHPKGFEICLYRIKDLFCSPVPEMSTGPLVPYALFSCILRALSRRGRLPSVRGPQRWG